MRPEKAPWASTFGSIAFHQSRKKKISKAAHSIFKPQSLRKERCYPPQRLYLTGPQKYKDGCFLPFKDPLRAYDPVEGKMQTKCRRISFCCCVSIAGEASTNMSSPHRGYPHTRVKRHPEFYAVNPELIRHGGSISETAAVSPSRPSMGDSFPRL